MTIKYGDCSVPDCRNAGVRIVRGLCMAHYERLRKYGTPLGGGCLKGDPLHHFRTAVMAYEGDDCLTWPYAKSAAGYAQMTLDGRVVYVHRQACVETHGPAPTTRHEVAHSCGKGHMGCVNPNHLAWKTPNENQADRVVHGTSNRGERQWNAKLTEQDVLEIKQLIPHVSDERLGVRYGVHSGTIGAIRRGTSWSWLTENSDGKMENEHA